MKHLLRIVLFAWWAALAVRPAVAQDESPERIYLSSHGDSVLVRHYRPEVKVSTGIGLLLVPGWPASSADVLGLGATLSATGIDVFVLQPRGHGTSGGVASFAGALDDVEVVWSWLGSADGGGILGLSPEDRVLGGYRWGGGIAMAFAAKHESVTRAITIAGSDHGVFIRRIDSDPEYSALLRGYLLSTRAPDGPVRFDLEDTFEELRTDVSVHDLVTIAPQLCGRRLLVVAGWDDQSVEVEHQVLPFYRALRACGDGSAKIVGFQDTHAFRKSRAALAETVREWLVN